jgi:hypothetical protein
MSFLLATFPHRPWPNAGEHINTLRNRWLLEVLQVLKVVGKIGREGEEVGNKPEKIQVDGAA